MKKNVLMLVLTIAAVTCSFSTFAQQSKEAASARRDLKKAKIDSAADFQKFKKDSELKIAENQKKIDILKAKKSSDTKEIKAKYDNKVMVLQKTNQDLEKKIRNADDTKTSMWTSFKKGFKHEMDELDAAISKI